MGGGESPQGTPPLEGSIPSASTEELAAHADQLDVFDDDLIQFYESWLFTDPDRQDQESVGRFIDWVRDEIKRHLIVKRGRAGVSYQEARDKRDGVKRAPWTDEEVRLLNQHQQNPQFHPFTCGSGNRTDEKHLDGEGVLVATPDGWVCPYCDYRQDWCHQTMIAKSS